MSIVEFLLARIAEDEDRAEEFERHYAHGKAGDYSNESYVWGSDRDWGVAERLGFIPARVLAECQAKRRIVTQWIEVSDRIGYDLEDLQGFETLRYLAAVYADHPDFDEAW